MPDNLKKTGKADRRLIALGQDHERAYWTRKLGVSIERLREVIIEVGYSVDNVKARIAEDSPVPQPTGENDAQAPQTSQTTKATRG